MHSVFILLALFHCASAAAKDSFKTMEISQFTNILISSCSRELGIEVQAKSMAQIVKSHFKNSSEIDISTVPSCSAPIISGAQKLQAYFTFALGNECRKLVDSRIGASILESVLSERCLSAFSRHCYLKHNLLAQNGDLREVNAILNLQNKRVAPIDYTPFLCEQVKVREVRRVLQNGMPEIIIFMQNDEDGESGEEPTVTEDSKRMFARDYCNILNQRIVMIRQREESEQEIKEEEPKKEDKIEKKVHESDSVEVQSEKQEKEGMSDVTIGIIVGVVLIFVLLVLGIVVFIVKRRSEYY